MSKLKSGDNVYGIDLKSCMLSPPILIDKCSENFAISICGKYKFNNKIKENNSIDRVGDIKENWFSVYYLENPELIDRYKRQILIYDIKNFNYNNLSTTWLEEIKNSLTRKK